MDSSSGFPSLATSCPSSQKLTYLEARGNVILPAEALQHLSCLQLLHTVSLDLGRTSHASTAALSALQDCKQLEDLELKRMGAHLALSTAPVLQHHAGQLTALKLTCCSMDTAILSCMSLLQQLDLVRVQLLPSEASVLLQLLPTLQQLQQLRLSHLSTTWPPASAAYAALTASPALQQLELCSCSIPAAAWQFIFPPQHGPQGARLTKLKKLFLGQQWVSRAAAREVVDRKPGSGLCTADVERFVRCCSGLQQLQLWCQLQPGVVLTALQALAALKLLRLSGVSASQALITTLVQLTGLQHLCLLLLPSTHCALPTDLSNNSSSSSSALALQELAPLTAIRGLTHLTVHGVQPAAASSPGDGGVVLHSKAPQGSPPDVCDQLHGLCESSMHAAKPGADPVAAEEGSPIMART